jgi:hypothetical protein
LRYFKLILLLLPYHFPAAQTVHRPAAALYTGLGAYSVTHADAFSFTANQASLAQLKNTCAGIYSEKRFLLKELALLLAALPTRSGNFGLAAGYFGFSGFNETRIGLAYARSLGTKVDIGLQFNYYGVNISGYGSGSSVNVELGTLLHLTEQVHAGVQISNPFGSKLGKNGQEKLASIYSFGMGYEPSEKFLTSAVIEKVENHPVNVKAGFQYKFLPQLLFRSGISTAGSELYFGAGLLLKSFRLDVAVSTHPHLGITPGLFLLCNFSNRAKHEVKK